MMKHREKREFIDALAMILCHHTSEKSVLLSMAAGNPTAPYAALVKEWGTLRTRSKITGWAGIEDAKETLTRNLWGHAYFGVLDKNEEATLRP